MVLGKPMAKIIKIFNRKGTEIIRMEGKAPKILLLVQENTATFQYIPSKSIL